MDFTFMGRKTGNTQDASKSDLPQGQLFIVATPIGNLGDFSFRAVETLKSCDYVLCEDTRRTRTLLNRYEIKIPLKSFHKFSEAKKEESILKDLRSGLSICLLSDAGTPLIADPGMKLTQRCASLNIPLTHLPGACSIINALVLSSFPSEPFQFVGFAPKKSGQLTESLKKWLSYGGTTLFFAPARDAHKIITLLMSLSPEREVAIVKEMTKKFERVFRGVPKELLALIDDLKGECVFLLHQEKTGEVKHPTTAEIIKNIEELEKKGLSKKEAIKKLSLDTGLSKNMIYRQTLQKKVKDCDK